MPAQGVIERGDTHPLVAPHIGAGLTWGSLGSKGPTPPFHPGGIPGRISTARRSLPVAEGAPGHAPRTVEVDVQSISAAKTPRQSPRTSGVAAPAPAAVAGRERPRETDDGRPIPHPLCTSMS